MKATVETESRLFTGEVDGVTDHCYMSTQSLNKLGLSTHYVSGIEYTVRDTF